MTICDFFKYHDTSRYSLLISCVPLYKFFIKSTTLLSCQLQCRELPHTCAMFRKTQLNIIIIDLNILCQLYT